MDRGLLAAELYESGYNCAQAVAVAFHDLIGMTEKQAARTVSAFGGGMGRLREVCGAVSGMLMVVSILYGYDTPGDDSIKMAHYALVQDFAAQFKDMGSGSIICREILKNPPSDPKPSERPEEFYRLRPCARLCYNAGHILETYIAEHPIEN